MFNVRRHGGSCCGMSHIYALDSLYYREGTPQYEVLKAERRKHIVAACNRAFTNNKLRGWWREGRGVHLIEAVTAERNDDPFGQTRHIGPILGELGFEIVTTFRNANSGNEVTVWHLLMDKKIT